MQDIKIERLVTVSLCVCVCVCVFVYSFYFYLCCAGFLTGNCSVKLALKKMKTLLLLLLLLLLFPNFSLLGFGWEIFTYHGMY